MTNEILCVGFDNNPSGAIAAISFNSGLPKVVDCVLMPTTSVGKYVCIDEREIHNKLTSYTEESGNIIIGFEIGQRQPMFGTKGNFSNGYSYGVLRTLIRLSGFSHVEVNPKTWQKVILKDIRGAEMSTKEASIEYCSRMFPDVSLLPSTRCTKKHDGMTDAICIAMYTRQQIK